MSLGEFIYSDEFMFLGEFMDLDEFMSLGEFMYSDEFIFLGELMYSDEFILLGEFMFLDEFTALYENSYIIWIHALLAQFLICGCNYFLHLWCGEHGKTVMLVSERVLMRVKYCKEDLFTLLLHCWQLHFLMEVATVEIAK